VLMPRFRAIFREFGRTEQQWRILRVLWENDDLSSVELAQRTLISAPSLVGILDRLEARNLVKRLPNPADRRSVVIAITGNGRKLKETISPRVQRVYEDIESSIEADIWDQLHAGLECVCRIELPGCVLDENADA